MNSEAKITIIMPVYNAEKHLKKSIDSILSQTFENFTLFIINDGSTDKSEEIICSYNDGRIKYIKNESNLGIVMTLNKGLDLADTKYIARMDADDICDEKRLELQYQEMENDEDLVLLGTSADLINENDDVVGEIIPPQDDVKIRTGLLFSNVFIHSSIMIRNSILKENNWRYDIKHKAVEDYGLWTKVSEKYKVGILPLKLLKYRINTCGIMANANKDKKQLIVNHSVIYKEYLERSGISIDEDLLLNYANFINVNNTPKLELSQIGILLNKIKANIISKDKYDMKLYESLLSSISRSYAIGANLPISEYYHFLSKNRLFESILLEIIKLYLSKIKKKWSKKMNIKNSIYQGFPLSIKIKHDIKKNIKNKIQKQIAFKNNKPRVYIIGESDNGNVGDLAISVTHYNMIKEYVGSDCQIIRILFSNFWNYYVFLKKNIRKCDLITIPGGGNIGDVYFEAEMIRQTVINEFKDNEIIIFPSTVFFSKGYEANELYKRSLKIYNKHSNLTIFARESYSYELLKKLYNNINVYLIPDMVFQYKYNNDNTNKKNEILLCLRNDDEKSLTSEDKNKINEKCSQLCSNVIYTDTFTPGVYAPIDKEREIIINQKLNEFSSARLIITDRLHGMILAYLTKTPCIVFANYNHKVKGVYQWIVKDENVFFASNIQEGINKIEEMYGNNRLESENIDFDYKLLENKLKKWQESNNGKNKR